MREGNTDDLTDAALDKAGEAGADVEAECDEGGRSEGPILVKENPVSFI